MFLNLAAAWKALAQQIGDDDPDVLAEDIEQYRRLFYCGAWATLNAQRAIIKKHDGKPATILLRALWSETIGVVDNEVAGE